MRRHGKTFAFAARVLPAAVRRDASVLYAFARHADDLVDEPSLGSCAERRAAFSDLRQAMAGRTAAGGPGAPAAAVRELLARNGVGSAPMLRFLDALEGDFEPRRIATLNQLLEYAHGVAGCVGLMMRPLLGADPEADAAAAALGRAMQLTNVARDVQEDWVRDRLYLPAELLPCAPPPGPLPGQARDWVPFSAVAALVQRAEPLYHEGLQGIGALEPACRRGIRTAALLYREIGHRILAVGPQGYWQSRVHLSWSDKLALACGWRAPAPFVQGGVPGTGLPSRLAAAPPGA
jgi:phytoene synthase